MPPFIKDVAHKTWSCAARARARAARLHSRGAAPTTVGGAKTKRKKNNRTRNRVTTYANDLTANQMTSLWNGRSVNHHLVVK